MSFWNFHNFENSWETKIIQKLSKSMKNSKFTQMQLHEYYRNTVKYTKLSYFDCFSRFLIIREIWNDVRVFGWFSRFWTIFENLIDFGVFEWLSTFWMNFYFLSDCRVHEWFSSFSMIVDLLNDTREFVWFWSICMFFE